MRDDITFHVFTLHEFRELGHVDFEFVSANRANVVHIGIGHIPPAPAALLHQPVSHGPNRGLSAIRHA